MVLLGDKNVGDIVKIKENGTAVNYIIVHKGLPSSMYDSSCDGVWLLREQEHSKIAWDTNNKNNDYENSSIKTWLNETFLNTVDEKIREAIRNVKIPYKKGIGNDASTLVQSGSNGLSCKVFLLSGYEVGFTTTDNAAFPVDGAKLSYFLNGRSDDAKARRIYKDSNGSAALWWLRSPCTAYDVHVWSGGIDGGYHFGYPHITGAVRPAFVLPFSIPIGADGIVGNDYPTITSDKTGNLGTLTGGFTCNYSVDDADEADSVNVTLSMDNTTIQTFAAIKGQQYTYSLTGDDWLKITNGEHTFKISATDGKDTVESAATFTRECKKATITLESALPADDIIRFCSLKIKGALPMDTILKCEVTNNANDAVPVWEDCTAKVKSESTYIFKNNEAANGFAFNFRISVERGASGVGGYIEKILGGFE